MKLSSAFSILLVLSSGRQFAKAVPSPTGCDEADMKIDKDFVPPGQANSGGKDKTKKQKVIKNKNLSPGQEKKAISVCLRNSKDKNQGEIVKEFELVHSTPYGNVGGQPLESFDGIASDGSSLSYVLNQEGNPTGSIVDPNENTITDISPDADGVVQSLTLSVDDYPDEGEPMEEEGSIDSPERIRARNLEVEVEQKKQRQQQHKQRQLLGLRGGAPASSESSHQDHHRKLLDDSGGNMDVMVVWTKKAECANSNLAESCALTATTKANMEARVDLAISETNTAYSSSGVNSMLNLVHAYRHESYSEASGFNQALTDLRTQGDGKMDDVHTERALHGADIVALLIDDPMYCGLGYLGPASDLMFSVTAWNCATGYYSFGHEIGHNQGCNHDKGTKNACSSPNYNYGWRDPEGGFRSILAYSCRTGQCDNNPGGRCTRVKMFSNDQYTYNGKSMGDATTSNARRINDVRASVAGYFPHVTDSSPTLPPVNPPTSAPVNPTAAPVNPPTAAPVNPPTAAPVNPTAAPVNPTAAPVNPPTSVPVNPTSAPINPPTAAPVNPPTAAPVNPPTAAPVNPPTSAPVNPPTAAPVTQPTTSGPVDPVELDFQAFDNSWGGWYDGGSDARRSSKDAWYCRNGGGRCVRLRDNSGTSSSITKKFDNLGAYDALRVEFYFYPESFESNEDFFLEYNDGNGWKVAGQWIVDANFQNEKPQVTSAEFTLGSDSVDLRFRCDASTNGDRVFIDDVRVLGLTN